MAVLIPAVPKDCPAGERVVYEKIGRELPETWVALHSLGLPRHERKVWGEADIVLLSTHGVFALEVKGGKVSCLEGEWTYAGPGFKTYTRKEDPWTQSKTAMMAVRSALHNANAAFRDVLFGYGVVMPFCRFDARGAEIVPEVLNDRSTFRQGMDQYVGRLHRHWDSDYAQKHGRAYRSLTPHQIREARQILRPDLETALSLGGWLTGVDAEILQLTNAQIRISRRLAANPRSIVTGPAGTGKSILALDRARHLASSGARVLYLCFNRVLAGHVSRSLEAGGLKGVEAWHAHGLYGRLVADAGMGGELAALNTDDPAFFAERFPELAAIAALELGREPWDALVVDEAQDLLTPSHLDTLDLLVRDGLEGGVWHLFHDPNQNLYDTDVRQACEIRLAGGHPVRELLEENCRNTRQVATQASITSGIDLPTVGAPEGPDCDVTFYGSRADGLAALEAAVAELLKGEVRPSDVVVLSTRQLANSLLAGVSTIAGRAIADVGNGPPPPGTIAFSTMHSFKGLDRLAVLAIDMTEIGDPLWSMLHYAGLSRARCLLRCFAPEAAAKRYSRQAIAWGKRVKPPT
ncbi:NERD domain-containing protein [Methylobacterium sp. Leaf117]|uniref:nuclease-related domain-containing DEAD/DEAH box helicase n=1 Tax=Methylobacterium sp. Leaf117 TaxID=1736260 RepID=UPI0006FF064B|nr:NERD domain-containing protein [Methylobacterium sp. Leaf117]KQP91928.1 nuclease [Methylobacterium sp. Leaf117]